MSSDSSKNPENRPDLEAARRGMKVQAGVPPVGGLELDGPEGTFPDKPGPDGPPTPKIKPIPAHLKKIINFFQGIIADEGLLLEMCFAHTMIMVKDAVNANAVGVDFFAGGNGDGGASFTAGHYATIAGPMACELYKQVLVAVKDRAAEYEELLKEATRERQKNSPSSRPGIIIPEGIKT